jgi:hypothetical protein
MKDNEILEMVEEMECSDDLLPDEEIYRMILCEFLKRSEEGLPSQEPNIRFILEEMAKNKVVLSEKSLREMEHMVREIEKSKSS